MPATHWYVFLPILSCILLFGALALYSLQKRNKSHPLLVFSQLNISHRSSSRTSSPATSNSAKQPPKQEAGTSKLVITVLLAQSTRTPSLIHHWLMIKATLSPLRLHRGSYQTIGRMLLLILHENYYSSFAGSFVCSRCTGLQKHDYLTQKLATYTIPRPQHHFWMET